MSSGHDIQHYTLKLPCTTAILRTNISSHLQNKKYPVPNGTIFSSFLHFFYCPSLEKKRKEKQSKTNTLSFVLSDIMPHRRKLKYFCLHVTVQLTHSKLTSAPKLTIVLELRRKLSINLIR